MPQVQKLRLRDCRRGFGVFLMFGLPGDKWLRLVIWLVAGLAIYFFYGRNHSLLARDEEAGL
jgi:APA family basic amino acid/polyamine antiporter